MRRSRAYGAMALLAGGAVALSGCGSSGSGGSSGAANNGPSNADPQALALSQPYVRPKVPDMGSIAVAVDETMTNYNNNLATTNNVSNFYIDNLVQGCRLALTHPAASGQTYYVSDRPAYTTRRVVEALPSDSRWRTGHFGILASVAAFTEGEPWAPHVVVDRNLVTGQNPASSAPLADEVLKKLG